METEPTTNSDPNQPGTSGKMTLKIEYGALMEAPQWESHRRGNNWAAEILTIDPKEIGGYGKRFISKAKGEGALYVVSGFKELMPVVFAGDYTSGGGNKTRHRTYAVVLSMTDSQMVIQTVPSYKGAWELAHELQQAKKDAEAAASKVALQPTPVPDNLREIIVIDPNSDPPVQVIVRVPPTILDLIMSFKLKTEQS